MRLEFVGLKQSDGIVDKCGNGNHIAAFGLATPA